MVNIARLAVSNGDEQPDLNDVATVLRITAQLLDQLDTRVQNIGFKLEAVA